MQAASKLDLESVAAEYMNGLLELTFNSKPLIDSLTVVAQETVAAAQVIVATIEERIKTAPSDEKLPALYLMDSICKFARPDNVRQAYVASFTRNIVKVFGNAFQMVDDEVKQRLERLMETWRVQSVFPNHILVALESIVRQWKASWAPPVAAVSPFAPSYASPMVAGPALPLAAPGSASLLAQLAHQIDALLVAKLQTQAIFPADAVNNQQLSGLQQLKQMVESGALAATSDPSTLQQVLNHVQHMYVQTFPPAPALPLPVVAEPPRLSPRLASSFLEDASNVINRMQGPVGVPSVEVTSHELGRATVARVGRVMLTTEDINRKRPGAHAVIYEAYPQQCRQCGFRFPAGEEGKERMGLHMDYHFRQNKRVMEKGKKLVSRDWFVTKEDWLENREAKTSDDQSPFFGMDVLKPDAEAKKLAAKIEASVPSVKAPEGDTSSLVCPVCHEKFVRYWDEEKEEWMLRDAMMFEGKLRHYSCHQEMGSRRARSLSPDPAAVKRSGSPAVSASSVLGKRSDRDEAPIPAAKRERVTT
ncbi:hypothetical protein DFJ74DRAFT_672325 [Hyaloraphidium curvatum]|nr:hypothetical protein DFJ74DRAFT_672325 [Hyaloraphidium curvatum]